MAQIAASDAVASFVSLRRSMAPFPGRAGFALRLALCCAMTAFVALYYGTPEAALTTYLVLFVNKPDRMSSLVTAFALTVLATIVIGLLLLLARFVLADPSWRVLSMAALSFVLLFLASASKLKPIAGTLALIAAYALDVLGSVPAGDLATRGLLYAWLFVAIPAGVSAIVDLVLAPAPRRLVLEALAQRLEVAARALRQPALRQAVELTELLRAGNAAITGHLKLAKTEDKSRSAELAALARAADASLTLLGTIGFMLSDGRAVPAADLRHPLADAIEHHADALRRGEPVSPGGATSDALLADGTLAADVHAALHSALVAEPARQDPAAAMPAKPEGGFLLPDAFTNPEHTRYAIKTTAAAMGCYLLYSLTSWPGIHTCLITCYIVSLGTLAESVRKLSLRIAGCLAGAALGLLTMIFVIPNVTTILPYLLLLFVGALPAMWVAAGSERVAYAGFQIAFAFFLCVIQGSGPGFDMVVMRDRVIGILVGIGAMYLVSSCLWPVSVRTRLEAAMAELDQLRSQFARAASRREGRELGARVQAAQAAVENDIELARLEPEWVRPPDDWLVACEGFAARSGAEILALTVRVELQAQASDALRVLASERLDAVPRVPVSGSAISEDSLAPF